MPARHLILLVSRDRALTLAACGEAVDDVPAADCGTRRGGVPGARQPVVPDSGAGGVPGAWQPVVPDSGTRRHRGPVRYSSRPPVLIRACR